MDLTKIGIIVGRFQVSELTNGHKELIEYALSHYDKVIIFLGTTPHEEVNKENPLSFSMRKNMIWEAYDNIFKIFPIQDKFNFPVWVQNLDMITEFYISHLMGNIPYEVTMIGSRNSFIEGYAKNSGLYKTELYYSTNSSISGTNSRENDSKKEINSVDFRKGIIYNILNNS